MTDVDLSLSGLREAHDAIGHVVQQPRIKQERDSIDGTQQDVASPQEGQAEKQRSSAFTASRLSLD